MASIRAIFTVDSSNAKGNAWMFLARRDRAMKILRITVSLIFVLVPALAQADFRSLEALAAPSADPWSYWQSSDESNVKTIDFSVWDDILSRYVAPSKYGINLFKYADVAANDRAAIDGLVTSLAALPIRSYNRSQQIVYWINLYNALTVKVVLDNGPVKTIRDIDISPGFFSDGPWGKKLLKIEGQDVTLNDIEHRILRPFWKDPRIHYVLNCASLGCPNLGTRAYEAGNLDEQLDIAAHTFINHPRGARLENGQMIVSSLYDWFTVDFGGDEAGVIAHLRKYAGPDLMVALNKHGRLDRAEYNWKLNGSF